MSDLLRLVLLLSVTSLAISAPLTCPNIDDLKPCTCKRVLYGLHVKCENFNTSTTLVRAFKIIKDYTVHTIILHKLYFDEALPDNVFDDMKVKEIKIDRCQLKFTKQAFSGLETSLNILNVVEDTKIKSGGGQEIMGKFSLARLRNLNELYVQRNKLSQINDEWLNDKVPSVQIIVLDYNEISNIGDKAFSRLKEIKSVSLADNRIKVIHRSMFPRPAQHLTKLDLSCNELKDIPSDFFEDMPLLIEVALTQNDLITLSERTWLPVWEQLLQLWLLDNQLNCGADMDWIKRHHRPPLLEGNCVAPPNMKHKPITNMYNL